MGCIEPRGGHDDGVVKDESVSTCWTEYLVRGNGFHWSDCRLDSNNQAWIPVRVSEIGGCAVHDNQNRGIHADIRRSGEDEFFGKTRLRYVACDSLWSM